MTLLSNGAPAAENSSGAPSANQSTRPQTTHVAALDEISEEPELLDLLKQHFTGKRTTTTAKSCCVPLVSGWTDSVRITSRQQQ